MKYLHELGKKSREAFSNNIDTKIKNKVLNNFIILINKRRSSIINQNKKDIKNAKKKGLRENLINRLVIDSNKIDQIISSIKLITKLKDPVNKTLDSWRRPNGLIINKTTIPIGVIAVIYESRPNVTSDVSSLCFKSGNCVILKGGSEAYFTNKILVDLFRKSLRKCNVNENFVQFVNVKNRKVVDFMLSKMEKYLDVVIPRGGKGLVKRVQKLSKVSVIGHLEGICHTYIDQDASLDMAVKIVKNAKLRNTAICGATETLLIHNKIIKKFSKKIINSLESNGCKVYADTKIRRIFKGNSSLAKEKDWSTEYLSAQISIKSVKNIYEAIDHINKYGTMHTDAIITKNKKNAKIFIKGVKSSIAIHNASTQFADGGEFGFGGEVGISTNKMPPRGPVGLNQLVSYKYEIIGKGQIRK
tara:strand:+ start:1224 stop:2471 length:1248 start_codon:yes stop_codon:yes gene_type:complete